MSDISHQEAIERTPRSLDEMGQTLASLAHHDALTGDERGACEDALELIERLERGETATCAECGGEVLQTACGCETPRHKLCESLQPPPGKLLLCSLNAGHAGAHKAVARNGRVFGAWPNDSEVTA